MEQDRTCSFELEGATVLTSEVEFRNLLYEYGSNTAIYLVSIRGREYTLKVVSKHKTWGFCKDGSIYPW